MNLNNYMLKSLNCIAQKYGYRVRGLENKKDKTTRDILEENVLILDNEREYFDSWKYRLKLEFTSNKAFKLVDIEHHIPWVPIDLLSDLASFIATAITMQIRHDKTFKYLVGIQEKKPTFFYYARKYFKNNQKSHYITLDMVDVGYLYGDYYKNFEISTELNKEYQEKYGDPVTCYFINLEKAKLIQENEKYCYECGNAYVLNQNPETKENYHVCYTCRELHKIRD